MAGDREVAVDLEKVFKALADPTRRHLLDSLHSRSGQTLGELCADLDMARQSVTQHVAVLEAANLVSSVRRGREKLHYLNPVPLYDIQERWIEKFERPRLRALSALKRKAEESGMADKPDYVYVTYIESTPERVWEALTDADLSARYWGHHNDSTWEVGADWAHRRADGSDVVDVVGTVVESDPPHRLVLTAAVPGQDRPEGPSRLTFEVAPHGPLVRLTVSEENFLDESERNDAAAGWPAVLSNLKSLLETGRPMSREPWLAPAGS